MCLGSVRIIDDNRPSAGHAFRRDSRKLALSKCLLPIAAADCVQGSGSGGRPSSRRPSAYDAPDEEALGVSAATKQYLVLWLLRQEANDSEEPEALLTAAERCLQKLCTRLAKLMTAAGCQSLMARAIQLATAEAPFLQGVRAGMIPGACLEGVHEGVQGLDSEQKQAGLVGVLTQLIGLLERLIGEDVTRRLVRDVWPDVPLGPGLTDSAPKAAPKEALS